MTRRAGTDHRQEAASATSWFSGGAPCSPAASSWSSLAAVAIFLVAQSIPAFLGDPAERPQGRTDELLGLRRPPRLRHGLGGRRSRSLIAVPLVASAIALFISHYAPRRVAQGLGYIIDLLAAVPSVVFGLWGIKRPGPGRPAALRLAQPRRSAGSRCSPAPVSGTGRTIFTVAHRARRHDPADHHGHQPRGLPADASRCTRRRPSRWAPPAGR